MIIIIYTNEQQISSRPVAVFWYTRTPIAANKWRQNTLNNPRYRTIVNLGDIKCWSNAEMLHSWRNYQVRSFALLLTLTKLTLKYICFSHMFICVPLYSFMELFYFVWEVCHLTSWNTFKCQSKRETKPSIKLNKRH